MIMNQNFDTTDHLFYTHLTIIMIMDQNYMIMNQNFDMTDYLSTLYFTHIYHNYDHRSKF